jgi:glycyl-tRNA synthetase (class II)
MDLVSTDKSHAKAKRATFDLGAHMKDDSIVKRMGKLIEQEHRLYEKGAVDEKDRARAKAIEIELDQCWDLLRQRRAKREFGDNPDTAEVRNPETVEGYKG